MGTIRKKTADILSFDNLFITISKFTSIQSWLHVFETIEAGIAAIADMLSPNEIWAMIGVPAAIPVTIMVGL